MYGSLSVGSNGRRRTIFAEMSWPRRIVRKTTRDRIRNAEAIGKEGNTGDMVWSCSKNGKQESTSKGTSFFTGDQSPDNLKQVFNSTANNLEFIRDSEQTHTPW